ncbi:MAG: anion permease [Deltaproteobacteria bacterium]|nr:anion permease [Deltaproteobacteria bacterium]
MWRLISGIFLGWTLGSNDSANIFGTGVAAKIIKYRTAIILISIFVILGAVAEGEKCFSIVGKLSNLTPESAFWTALAAGITMFVLTYLALPCSTSQAIIGAVLGAGMVSGVVEFSRLYKIVACWLLAPISAIIISFMLYHFIGFFFERYIASPKKRSFFIFWGLISAGCFGAYALGSNNVANVTGIYVGSGLLTSFEGALIGGLSIASGVLTYSKKVMTTVGKEITHLDEYAAFIAELSEATTVEIFTQVGVPVSTSQAIVGGVIGVGLVKGASTINKRTVIEIGVGWVSTPISAGIISYVLLKLFM